MGFGISQPGAAGGMTPQMAAMLQQYMQAPQGQLNPQVSYLQHALQAMQGQPQGSALGMGENLLASALDTYNLQRKLNQPPQLQSGQLPSNYTTDLGNFQMPGPNISDGT